MLTGINQLSVLSGYEFKHVCCLSRTSGDLSSLWKLCVSPVTERLLQVFLFTNLAREERERKKKVYLLAWSHWAWCSGRTTAPWTWGSPWVSPDWLWTGWLPEGADTDTQTTERRWLGRDEEMKVGGRERKLLRDQSRKQRDEKCWSLRAEVTMMVMMMMMMT